MRKDIKIATATVNTKLWALICDLLVLIASTVALYFGVLYSTFIPATPYYENAQFIADTNERYNLNLDKSLTYEPFEEVVHDFYFNQFPNEIKKQTYEKYNREFTIQHIYNFEVLRLPIDPTIGSYKTQFFAYEAVDGSFDVNKPAVKIVGSGRNYEKNMHDIFYGSYSRLNQMLMEFDKDYSDAVWQNNGSQCYSRIIAFAISLLVFYIIIPLSNKKGQTIFENIFGIAHIEFADGMLMKKWKLVLRPFILFFIPAFGIYFASVYSIVLLTIAPIFLMELPLVLSKNNLDLQDILLRTDVAFVKDSLLFRNEEEEKSYVESETFKEIQDKTYLDKLSNFKEIDLSVSRSDKISKENK